LPAPLYLSPYNMLHIFFLVAFVSALSTDWNSSTLERYVTAVSSISSNCKTHLSFWTKPYPSFTHFLDVWFSLRLFFSYIYFGDPFRLLSFSRSNFSIVLFRGRVPLQWQGCGRCPVLLPLCELCIASEAVSDPQWHPGAESWGIEWGWTWRQAQR
jgi:hypothetical protein